MPTNPTTPLRRFRSPHPLPPRPVAPLPAGGTVPAERRRATPGGHRAGAGRRVEPDRGAVVLTDGTWVPVRPIRPSDASALRRFHHDLSERTVYQRFFAPMPELSEDQARYFTSLDGRQRFALIALDPVHPTEVIAVVRFDRDPDGDGAEYAAVVADRWQGRGLGRALTQRLITAARRRGVGHLYAYVLPSNARMLRLLAGLGLPTTSRFGDRTEWIDVALRLHEGAG